MSASASASAAAAAAGTRQDLTDGGCAPHDPDLYAHSEIASSSSALLSSASLLFLLWGKGDDDDDDDSAAAAADNNNNSNSWSSSSSEAIAARIVEQYRRDGFVVFDNAAVDSSSSSSSTNPAADTVQSSSSSSSSSWAVEALSAALTDLTTGANRKFAEAVQAVVASGVTPNFTAGGKIPWVQYEAGTHVVTTTTTIRSSSSSSSNVTSATTAATASDGTLQHQQLLLTPSIAPSVRKLMGFVGYDPAIDAIVNNANLLKLVARLLACSSVDQVELFQDMALLKPAGGGREKPWHQDKAYFDVSAVDDDDCRVVGMWMAVDEANIENGCLRLERGGHLHGPRMHFAVRDYQLCDADAPKCADGNVVAVPLRPGGFVLFDGMIPHGTPTNTSPSNSRRALQFHWIRAGTRIVPENEPGIGRAHVFGGAPNGRSC